MTGEHQNTGQEHDADLGLINMHGRMYDPVMAEFLTPDPLMPNPSGRGLNAFSYVENQPLDFTDPSGFTPFGSDLVFDGTIYRQGYGYSFADETVQGFAPAASSAASTGSGMSSSLVGSATEATADAGAEVGSSIATGASYVGSAVGAGTAIRNLVQHAKPKVQYKPTRASGTAPAPGGSAGRSGPSGTTVQQRTEPPPNDFGRPVPGAADAQSALDPQRPVEHKVFNAAASQVVDTSPSLELEFAVFTNLPVVAEAAVGIAEYLATRGLLAAAKGAAAATEDVGVAASKLCFPAGTPILTPGGRIAIEDIRVGDEVFAFDQETGEIVVRAVEKTFENITDRLVEISYDGVQLAATMSHPFWVEGAGWKAAKDLETGMHLRTPVGTAEILSVGESQAEQVVYNFSVEGGHDYFAGDLPVLVHNQDFANYNDAVGKVFEWLRAQGVDTAKLTQVRDFKFGGRGLTTPDGSAGFRIEWHPDTGAHIDAFAGKSKLSHMKFPGNEKSVQSLQRILYCR